MLLPYEPDYIESLKFATKMIILIKAIMILLGTISMIKALRGFSGTSHLVRALIQNI